MFKLLSRYPLCLSVLLAVLGSSAVSGATVTLKLIDQSGQPLERAVVVVTSATLGTMPATPQVYLMDQVGKRFEPDVIAISKNDSVRFPNSDDIRHHVYSFSVPLTFELPLYSGEPENPVLFREPGMVVVGCNIHDRMKGYIYVIDNGLHAVSIGGKVTFAEVPDEELTITIYHPDAIAEPALRYVGHVQEFVQAAEAYAIELRQPAAAPDTSGMSELQKKFLQLRHAH